MSKLKTWLLVAFLSILIPNLASASITLKVENTWDKVVRIKEGRILPIDDDIFPGVHKTYTLYIAIDNFNAFYTDEKGNLVPVPNCTINGRESIKITFAASEKASSIPKCIFEKE